MPQTFVSPSFVLNPAKSLEQAIVETLSYSDVFDYPLTFDELHKYLVISVSKEEIKKFQKENGLTPDGIIGIKTLKKLSEIYPI